MNNDVYLFSSESENSFDLKKELEKITDFPVTNNLRTKFDFNEQSCFIETPFLDENSRHICLEVWGTPSRGFFVSDHRATLYGRFSLILKRTGILMRECQRTRFLSALLINISTVSAFA